MRKNSRCGNCGSDMFELANRQGMKVYVCPHIKPNAIRKISTVLQYPELWCHPPTTTKTYSEEPAAQAYAQTEALRHNFQALVARSDDKSLTIEKLQETTLGTISKMKLYEAANTALMLGLSAATLPTLFNSAIKLGCAMGITTDKAIESLTRGLGRESKKILDNIGILFKAREAYEWYKQEHKLRSLNEAQRKDAWRQYACKLIIEKAQTLTVSEEQVKMARRKAQIQNGTVEYGKKLLGA